MVSFKQHYAGPDGEDEEGYFPGLHLTGKPAIAMSDLEVGDEVTMTIKARVTSKSAHQYGNRTEHGIGFDVEAGEPVSSNTAEKMFGGE